MSLTTMIDRTVGAGDVVQRLPAHAAGQGAVADDGHDRAPFAADLERLGHAVGVGQRGRRVRVLDPVVRALGPARVARQPAGLAQRVEAVLSAGQRSCGRRPGGRCRTGSARTASRIPGAARWSVRPRRGWARGGRRCAPPSGPGSHGSRHTAGPARPALSARRSAGLLHPAQDFTHGRLAYDLTGRYAHQGALDAASRRNRRRSIRREEWRCTRRGGSSERRRRRAAPASPSRSSAAWRTSRASDAGSQAT